MFTFFPKAGIIRRKQQKSSNNLKKQKTMEFIIGCVIYIVVCESICNMLEFEKFNEKAWVYAIVSTVGGFLIKVLM